MSAGGSSGRTLEAGWKFIESKSSWTFKDRFVPRRIVVNLKEVVEAKRRVPALFKPVIRNGKYIRGPKYTARQVSYMRKRFLMAGVPWPYEVPKKEVHFNIPFKGTKLERAKPARQRMIEQNMRNMPKWIAEYREELKTRPRKVRVGTPVRAILMRGTGTELKVTDADREAINFQKEKMREFLKSQEAAKQLRQKDEQEEPVPSSKQPERSSSRQAGSTK